MMMAMVMVVRSGVEAGGDGLEFLEGLVGVDGLLEDHPHLMHRLQVVHPSLVLVHLHTPRHARSAL